LPEPEYQQRKTEMLNLIQAELNRWLSLEDDAWLHAELATPRGFAGWTGRPNGMVGGLGQHPSRFGPFGLAGRTPMPGLWLCGDSLHPGEGTAGVSLSALNACRQLRAERGQPLSFRS
jgi:phytoene dehydrogenase-like protein